MGSPLWILLVACGGDSPTEPPGGISDPTDTDTDTGGPTDTGGGPTDTGDPTGTEPCEVSEALSVVQLSTTQPRSSHELTIGLELSEPAQVAVACRLGDDEAHLVESTDPATTHVLRLSGLLADQTYRCAALPTCPRSSEEAHTFQVDTGPLDPRLPLLNTQHLDPAAGDEYVLLNHSDDCDWPTQELVVVDRLGQIRWWTETPGWVGPSVEFRYHGDDRFTWGGGWGPNDLGRPRQLDLHDGELYDSAVALPDVGSSDFHHDGKELPDGRLLTLEEVDVEDGWLGFRGFRVRRIDPVTDTVDFDYHSQRAFDEGHLPGGYGDVWHANWADVSEVNGEEVLFVSLCNLGWVVAIDVATGAWRWTFGDGGDFSLEDASGAPLGPGEFPQCEHGLEKQGDRLLVYDNGWSRGYSRATEYQLDEASLTATLLWTWTEPDWFETTLGDVDWMPDGRVLIGMGHAECFSSNPGDRTTVVELDPATGTKLWQASYDERQAMAYRADWADPCELFANAAVCPTVAQRLKALGL